jgi:superfamily II DNA helicase RecQ
MPSRRPPRNAARQSKPRSKKSAPPNETDIRLIARKNFGFNQLWPVQLEAMRSLLSRHDTLVVMPTGSGKSAIYQIAGLMLTRSVLIVSPLIALQKDQGDSINAGDGKAEACVINSSLKPAELRESLDRVGNGDYKFVFLAPEQLHKEKTIDAVEQARVSMFVIDEAHCISEWGHDFRPDYLQLGRVIESLGHPVTLAMTATGSERVRQEIIDRLGMKTPCVFVRGFDRPNIHLRVDHFDDQSKKLDAVLLQVRWASKPGIVYVAMRKTAEQIMRTLEEEGIKALFYHGGLEGSERDEIQNRFMSGDAEVILATNAFGMASTKPTSGLCINKTRQTRLTPITRKSGVLAATVKERMRPYSSAKKTSVRRHSIPVAERSAVSSWIKCSMPLRKEKNQSLPKKQIFPNGNLLPQSRSWKTSLPLRFSRPAKCSYPKTSS